MAGSKEPAILLFAFETPSPDMLRPAAERLLRAIPPEDPDAVARVGLTILQGDCGEVLLPLARNSARRFPTHARVQQVLGLAARASQQHQLALRAFAAASRLCPGDALLAHSHARAALELGRPAQSLFERARALAPGDGTVLLGLAAARVQEGKADVAIEDLTQVLASHPGWLEGHRGLARLRAQLGLPPSHSLRTAIAAHPRDPGLHQLLVTTLLEARDSEGAAGALAAAGEFAATEWHRLLSAHALSEAGAVDRASKLFAALRVPSDPAEAGLHARHLVRANRPEEAVQLLDAWLTRDPDNTLWPYRSLAWRLTGDPRHAWLEGDPRLVGIYDIAEEVGDLGRLARHLRSLHFATAAPLDQSVRGGTQTDGNLLLRGDPPLRALRKAVMRAVDRYVAQLPPPVAGHPTLLPHREPLRIAGSWSVRLEAKGHHADHVHTQGWLSSAFYVSLPESMSSSPGDDAAAWLSLGEARDLAPGLAPLRLIEPRPGRLVLFPSTMWHGTRPFRAGERLTVALDIARPQQS